MFAVKLPSERINFTVLAMIKNNLGDHPHTSWADTPLFPFTTSTQLDSGTPKLP